MTNKEELEWYKKHKRWGYVVFPIYKKADFNKALNELDSQFETYEYILNRLKDDDKIEFKYDYLDKLKSLESLQKLSKFRELIRQQISKVESYNVPQHAKSTNLFFFENKFDNVDEVEVFNYFKKYLVDQKRMSEADLMKYLKDAFELKSTSIKRYKVKTDTNTRIRKVFYHYYKNVAGKPYGRQSEYLNLLRGYFVGFENELTRNFSK